ncbi:RagB/SusD family nutrient uptake outer membrane protein [Mucilaginibacter mali]|uniref:RagB/SusD family nutrient uptake outer membrane protein n=1 Tax=Mucilaginibacter mali TaxID=2740462 RepID=A0A7D4UKR6_9SPHI|nr:RagB/SusD family nutrient uptake outer membrane protein [Mucilaginibacter mali]QKJ28781.1 RagB/SusD family nutrient uptake outer membrane protein [Mucilaginibacter mali]
MNFKRSYKFYAMLLIMGIAQTGCIKNETVPLDIKTEDLIYDKMDINGYYADQALTNLYTFLPKGFNRVDNSYLDAATDDAVNSQLSGNIDILAKGLQSPTQVVDDAFASNYTGIYRANQFLSKIDVVPITNSVKTFDKAEARFLRAMFYFELVKRYGGVPLLGDQVLNLNSNLKIARNSYADCVNYIVSECDAISGQLRTEPITTTLLGHATQGCALALKARTLLYAASPQNNPGNDAAKWTSAANAAKAVIDLNYYALNASFVSAFLNRADKEVILGFQQAKNQTLETAQAPVGYTNDLITSRGQTSPTQDLVDAFPTIKGLPIGTDIKSGTNTTGFDAANPYANRDPRMGATVFYNGQQWLGRAVETFEGGKDKPGGTLVQTKTGYYLRKFLPDLSAASAYSTQDHNFIIFRYAEILLDYAEAINEAADAASNRSTALAQLVLIRKRAGLTAGTPANYGITATTQSQMRDAIRLERRLELAFEEHRFWDERRWNTAGTDFNKTRHGITITKTGTTYNYQTKNVDNMVFIAPKMYLYPFAFSDLQSNTALTQNPGW